MPAELMRRGEALSEWDEEFIVEEGIKHIVANAGFCRPCGEGAEEQMQWKAGGYEREPKHSIREKPIRLEWWV
jgi:hypothetical protein